MNISCIKLFVSTPIIVEFTPDGIKIEAPHSMYDNNDNNDNNDIDDRMIRMIRMAMMMMVVMMTMMMMMVTKYLYICFPQSVYIVNDSC